MYFSEVWMILFLKIIANRSDYLTYFVTLHNFSINININSFFVSHILGTLHLCIADK